MLKTCIAITVYNMFQAGSFTVNPLNTSEFYAPLTHSLILTRGTGNPTYTRATTAWEFDNEGKLVTVPSGAARFGGARMVHNLMPTGSENLSQWTINSGTPVISSATGVDGTNRSIKLADTESGAFAAIRLTIPVLYANNSYLLTFYVLKEADTSSYPDFDLASNSFRLNKSTGDVAQRIGSILPTVSAVQFDGVDWWKVSMTFTPSVSGAVTLYCTPAVTTNWGIHTEITATGNVTVDHFQIENVTGQADQTAREYVSVGVLSAPYHGAGVDGVKYFNTNKDGSPISDASLLGYHAEGARTNSLMYSRDLTNAAWAATNITAAKTATGIDNSANSASTLTAGADNATILQTLALASAARSSSAYVKRRTGTGTIRFTRNGGTTWTDITGLINSSTWTRVKIENTSVLNPSVGFLIATSGDSIDVDVVQDEAGAFASSPIITTTAAVTRNADALSYQTASNWSDTAGAARASVNYEAWAKASGTAIGGTNGLALSTSTSGVQAKDGTNTVNGPTGTPSGTELLAIGWGSGAMSAASGGSLGTVGSYDGAFGLSTVAIGASAGYIKETHIWQSALTDEQLQTVTS